MAASPLIGAYERLHGLPLGRRIFSLLYSAAAPYFLTIPARVESVSAGEARAVMAHAPWVRNHLGTVHAIALCNLAEYTMGVVAEATVPRTHRWVPKGMTVEYRALARGTMRATATLALPDPFAAPVELPVAVRVADRDGTEVFTAEIRIWITEKKESA
jgi:acyl-coenzyme A thioesterase PaaI-like protein